MNIIKKLALMIQCVLLVACASTTEQTHYYTLGLNKTQQTVLEPTNSASVRVNLLPIQLAGFLKQGGLVVQVGESEIYTASYHRWAEPLEHSFGRLLLRHLTTVSGDHYRFSSARFSQHAGMELHLEIDKFHPTDQGNVVLAGRYTVNNKVDNTEVGQTFNIQEKLNLDGYPHTVEKLNIAVLQLARQITQSLKNIKISLNQ